MAFDAFMSYSHAADGQLAPALQHGLHRLNKPWYRKRALRIFRDKTSLSANPALWPAIERALSESSYFLLLASPASARSTWVTAEVNWWLSHRSIDKLLIVLTDGELSWNNTTGDFDWDRTDAIPRDLEGRFPSEPLYVDLRWARTVNDLSLRHGQFRGAVLDLAAPVHGIPKDELDGEDVRQYRRMRQVRFVAVSALIVFAALALWQAVVARMQATRAVAQRLAAQADLSRRDEAFSCLDRAALLAVTSLSMTPLLEANRLLQELLPLYPIASIRPGGEAQRTLVSPTGRHAAIQNNDGLTRVFDLASGKDLRPLEHTARPGTLFFDRTGTTLTSVVAVDEKTSRLRTVNLSTLAIVELATVTGSVTAVAVRADQTPLATVVSAGRVQMIDARTGSVLATVPAMYRETWARFSRSGRYLAVSSGEILPPAGVLHVIDTMTGEGHTLSFDLPIAAPVFDADDRYLALMEQFVWGSAGANAYIVDLATGMKRSTIPVPMGMHLLSFSPDGQRLALAGLAGLEIVSVPGGTRVSTPFVSGVSTAAFAPDSQSIVVATSSTSLPRIAQSVGDEEELELRGDYCDLGRLRVFDAESGRERFILDRKADSNHIVFSQDGDRLVVGGSRANGGATVDIFERSGFGSPVPLPEFDRFAAGRSEIERFIAEMTTDGTHLVAVGDRHVLSAFDLATRRMVGATDLTIAGPVALSQDGRHIAVTVAEIPAGEDESDPRFGVRVFEVATLKLSREVALRDAPVGVQIGNGARRLLTVSDEGKLSVVDLVTKASVPAGEVDLNDFGPIAFSADGTLLATTGDSADVLEIRDATRHTVVARLKHPHKLSSARFSPDGARLAAVGGIDSFGVGSRGSINVFDLSTEAVVLDVPYEGGAPALSFSSDGSILLVRLGTGVIRVFQLANGLELTRIAIAGGVGSMVVAGGNRRLLIVSGPPEEGLPRLYSRDLQPADLSANVCSRLTRNLTWDEWTQYFGDAAYEKSCTNLPCPAGGTSTGSNRCVRE